MKGLIVDIQPVPVRTVFTPLDTQFSLTVVGGGSTTQFFYTNENQYIPNRALVPMKLKPSLYIVDPDGKLMNGDHSSSLVVAWYENNVNTQIATGANYTVNADGSLTVKKNVPVSSPIQIICRATYTDARSGKPIVFEDRVPLNSIAKSDERVTVALDKDIIINYNPIKDNHLIDIKATVYIGSKVAPAANCAYFWYKWDKEVEWLIGSKKTDIEYVSGQGTATLRVDADNVDFGTYRCRAVYYTGAKPTAPTDSKIYATTNLKYKLPAQIRGEIYSKMGSVLRNDMQSMEFVCKVYTNTEEITNVNKYFLVLWYKKSTAAGSTPVQIGHGVSITIPAAELKSTGGQQMQVYPVVLAHGAYEVLTDHLGEPITDHNNEILIGY